MSQIRSIFIFDVIPRVVLKIFSPSICGVFLGDLELIDEDIIQSIDDVYKKQYENFMYLNESSETKNKQINE